MKFQGNDHWVALEKNIDEMRLVGFYLVALNIENKRNQQRLKEICLQYLKIVDNLPENDQTE